MLVSMVCVCFVLKNIFKYFICVNICIGFVNVKNCKELVKEGDVDGFFVGGVFFKFEFV